MRSLLQAGRADWKGWGKNAVIGQGQKNAGQVSEVLEKIAERKHTTTTSVALAYVMHKASYVFPVCGGNKAGHIKTTLKH